MIVNHDVLVRVILDGRALAHMHTAFDAEDQTRAAPWDATSLGLWF